LSAIVLAMSMSLDGFVTGPNATIENPLGEGGARLHDWMFPTAAADHHKAAEQQLSGVNRQLYDDFMSTGAVVAGRGTFEGAHGWGGDHHDGVPIWIVSRHEPGIDIGEWPNVTYMSDIVGAMTEAKRAAGDKKVLFHGAAVLAQLALTSGLLDELEITLVPVLLGGGRSHPPALPRPWLARARSATLAAQLRERGSNCEADHHYTSLRRRSDAGKRPRDG